MTNSTLSETELRLTYDAITMVARTAMYIPIEDVHRWLNTISMCHSLGPIMDPTAYRDGGMDNLDEQQVLAEGFLAFRRAIDKVRQMGAERSGGRMSDIETLSNMEMNGTPIPAFESKEQQMTESTTPPAVKEMDGLTEGRMVHYVMDSGPHVGDHRPAIVVKVWNKVSGTCNLQLFVDGQNDGLPAGQNVVWKTSIVYSEAPRPGTWHWIERA